MAQAKTKTGMDLERLSSEAHDKFEKGAKIVPVEYIKLQERGA